MAYLPKGYKFFAQVGGVRGQLHKLGLRCGDQVQCHMLNEGSKNPCVDLLINGKVTTVQNYKKGGGHYDRLVFSGKVDGTGFIDEDEYYLAKAVAELNGNPFTTPTPTPESFYKPSRTKGRNKHKMLEYIKNYGSPYAIQKN